MGDVSLRREADDRLWAAYIGIPIVFPHGLRYLNRAGCEFFSQQGPIKLQALFLPPMAWSPYARDFAAGSGPDPRKLFDYLAEAGIQSEIFDPYPQPWNPFSGRHTLLESFDAFRALRVLLSRRKIDIVVSVFESASVPLVLSRDLFGFKPPIVLWDIGLTENWPLRERFLDLSVPRVDGIMVLGLSQSAYIEKRWQAGHKTRVIFHRVDVDFFHPTKEKPEDYVLSVGDDEGRDYDTLLRAFEDSDFTLKLKSRRNIPPNLSGRSRIESIQGKISYLELRSLYARGQFVVVPLKQTLNASGVSTILETGAMGKAAIVSENQGIADFIVPGETCLTVPCRDPVAMRQAMERLSRDQGLRERLGRNARNFVTARFSDKVFAANFSNTLLEFSEKSKK